MKKILTALLLTGAVLAFAGCADDQSAQSMSQNQSGYQSGHSDKLGHS